MSTSCFETDIPTKCTSIVIGILLFHINIESMLPHACITMFYTSDKNELLVFVTNCMVHTGTRVWFTDWDMYTQRDSPSESIVHS